MVEARKRWFDEIRPEEIENLRAGNNALVVIDIWAATTDLVLMLSRGPSRLIITSDQRYLQAEKTYPGAIIIGESKKIPKEKILSSNDPYEIDKVDISNRIVLFVTNNGTRVLEALSSGATGRVFAGSLVNFRALVSCLKSGDFERIMIVAAGNLTGDKGGKVFIEDWLAADVFEKSLTGQEVDLGSVGEQIRKAVFDIYQEETDIPPEKRFWPYIFAPESDIVPTAFINSDGFVEVVNYGSG